MAVHDYIWTAATLGASVTVVGRIGGMSLIWCCADDVWSVPHNGAHGGVMVCHGYFPYDDVAGS
jgi:hypothetical protein